MTKKKGGERTIPVSSKGGSGGLLDDVSAYGHTNSKRGQENVVFLCTQLNQESCFQDGITHPVELLAFFAVVASFILLLNELSWSLFQYIFSCFLVTSCNPVNIF